MQMPTCRVLCLLLAVVSVLEPSTGMFTNTLNGFLQDIQNPSSLLTLLLLKYWLLFSTGAITISSSGLGKRELPSMPSFTTDDFYATVLSKMDNEQCIPRLICGTLSRRRDDSPAAGSEFERKLIQTFADKPLPESLANPKSPGFVYKYAAFIGKHASNPEACKQLFPKCKQNVVDLQKMATLVFESNV